jgi:hypothetical protein
MPFPRTDTDLAAQGYEFENKTRCRGCGAEIEFWLTPMGKHIPLDPGTLEPHWTSCPKSADYRKHTSYTRYTHDRFGE